MLAFVALGCGSDGGGEGKSGAASASTAGSGGAASGSSSSATTSSTTGGQLPDCSLPVAGAGGEPEPNGSAGGLAVLDWAGFSAAISYTFDDANSSQIDNYAELNALGVPFTFYLQTNKADAKSDTWAQALSDGHELGNHSHSHPQTADPDDVDQATQFIENTFSATPHTMAAPFGDASYQAVAEERFFLNRGVSNGLIAPGGNTNPFNLPCYVPAEGAAAGTLNGQVDSAVSGGGWRTLLVHGFTGGSDGAYQPVDLAEFVASVEYAKSLDVWIDTVETIGAYWIGQKLIASATPSGSGDAETVSWTLPGNFPPGKCVRVVVDGGTVSQGGQPVAWDEHGYYTVSLDAGSLTVAP